MKAYFAVLDKWITDFQLVLFTYHKYFLCFKRTLILKRPVKVGTVHKTMCYEAIRTRLSN